MLFGSNSRCISNSGGYLTWERGIIVVLLIYFFMTFFKEETDLTQELNHPVTSESMKEFIASDPKAQELAQLGKQCGDKLMVVFIHVPKAGGTSVHHMLEKCSRHHHNMRSTHGFKTKDFLLEMSPKEQSKYRGIEAHMGYGVHLQPNYPQDRKNCTFYITTVRPMDDLIWSKFRYQLPKNHIYFSKKAASKFVDESIELVQSYKDPALQPWFYAGSVTYQFCCFHDFQHERFRNDVSQETISEIDPNCPLTHEERYECAAKRLEHDFALIGDTKNPESMDLFYKRLGALMDCPHIKPLHSNPSRQWPSKDDDFSQRYINFFKTQPGAKQDDDIMKLGSQLALAGSASPPERTRN